MLSYPIVTAPGQPATDSLIVFVKHKSWGRCLWFFQFLQFRCLTVAYPEGAHRHSPQNFDPIYIFFVFHFCIRIRMLRKKGSHRTRELIKPWRFQGPYSLNKKEWICSLFKEWILEKSEIRVNLEWTFVLFTHFGVTSGITRNPWVIPVVTPKWVNNTNVHSKFTLISLFSKFTS